MVRAETREERLALGREWTLELKTMEHLRDAASRVTEEMQSGESWIGVPFARMLMARTK